MAYLWVRLVHGLLRYINTREVREAPAYGLFFFKHFSRVLKIPTSLYDSTMHSAPFLFLQYAWCISFEVLFSRDVTAAMLVYRTIAKKVLGIWFYYYAKLERHFGIVLCTNMAVSSREWKPGKNTCSVWIFLPILSQVIFEAVRGGTYHSDIAIDDVSFSTECYPSEGKRLHLFESE